MKNRTILMIDDTIENLDILGELLSEYDLIDATSGKDALEIVKQEERIDLILLDIIMPDMDGYEVCRRLKADIKTKNIPIIFITAKADEVSIEKAYDIGIADYITKPFMKKELLARVKKELQIQCMIDELKLLASTDSMTKLYNRRYFLSAAAHIFDIGKRENKELSLIMIDIDKFKNINDTYGHKVGDEVIIALADKLKAQQRKSDIIARFGGEEFVILLPATSLNGAILVAQKIKYIIEQCSMLLEGGEVLKYTASLGVARVRFCNETNIESALKRADDALYVAKLSGRNKVCDERQI